MRISCKQLFKTVFGPVRKAIIQEWLHVRAAFSLRINLCLKLMKKIVSTLLACAAMSTSGIAAAQGFVAADIGDYSSGSYSPVAFAFSGGLKVAPNVAIEVGYVAPNSYTYNFGGTFYTFDQSILKGAGVVSFPVAPQIDLFGKLGFAHVRWSDVGPGWNASGSSTNLMFGFGGQYNISRQLAVRGQYEYFGNNVGLTAGGSYVYRGTSMLSVGAVYSF